MHLPYGAGGTQPGHDGDAATTPPSRCTTELMHNAARRSRAILMHLSYGAEVAAGSRQLCRHDAAFPMHDRTDAQRGEAQPSHPYASPIWERR